MMFNEGRQPCDDFKPEEQYRLQNYTHQCPICITGERVFCLNCGFDHHKFGWDTCHPKEDAGTEDGHDKEVPDGS